MAVPESVPRPLVDNASANTLQPVPQPVSPSECRSACRPAGCQPRKQPRWPHSHKSSWGEEHSTVTHFVLDQRVLLAGVWCCVQWAPEMEHLCSCFALLVWHCPKVCLCLSVSMCVCVCVCVCVWLPRCAPPPLPPPPSPPPPPPLLLLAVHSRQGSDQPCVVFSDGAWTWSLSRGNGLFSLPGLHKEPHCSSPHIPRWLPTPGFGLPGRRGLRLQELFFFFFWPTARNIVYPLPLHLVPNLNTVHSNILVLRFGSSQLIACESLLTPFKGGEIKTSSCVERAWLGC